VQAGQRPGALPEKEVRRPGDSTKRIVVLLFSFLLAGLAVATSFKGHFGLAAFFGVPALVFFAIALSGSSKSVDAAKKMTDITDLP